MYATQRETLRDKPIKRDETCKESRLAAIERQQQLMFEMMQTMMQGMQNVSLNNPSSKSDISIQSTIRFGRKAYKNAFVQKATLPRSIFRLEGVEY